ncbi:hypothetical protein C8D95_107172 [Silicimonas algicola]|uniref:Uncharacterized protein n=1 Tax=Silicimonas algicola TaxID=1826607 RepID=A0A316G6C6_9RHOB|nr:hypothetical protein C8D95_107172 [Silicimonas algicola]
MKYHPVGSRPPQRAYPRAATRGAMNEKALRRGGTRQRDGARQRFIRTADRVTCRAYLSSPWTDLENCGNIDPRRDFGRAGHPFATGSFDLLPKADIDRARRWTREHDGRIEKLGNVHGSVLRRPNFQGHLVQKMAAVGHHDAQSHALETFSFRPGADRCLGAPSSAEMRAEAGLRDDGGLPETESNILKMAKVLPSLDLVHLRPLSALVVDE